MKQENKKISIYKKIRRSLYIHVAETEHKNRIKLILAILCTLLVASLLFFTAALIETNDSRYTSYYFGDTEQRVKDDLATMNNISYVDMNALADYLELERSTFFSSTTFAAKRSSITFTHGSDVATVNGIEITMTAPASIQNGYCLVPTSEIEALISGITVTEKDGCTTITKNGETVYMIAKNNLKIQYETDVTEFLDYINSKNEYVSILVNKQNSVDESFPEDKDSLIEIPEEYRKPTRIYLYRDALYALKAMMNDMFALGFDDIFVTSAYRRYVDQETLFEGYIAKEMQRNPALSREEAKEIVLTYSSEPGKSEHQTGLCVDFMTPAMRELENYGHEGAYSDDIGFAETDAFLWLIENSWKYGFILRYPEDKVAITGYSYESWHYRFVGLETAAVIHQTGLCYEEYLETFK